MRFSNIYNENGFLVLPALENHEIETVLQLVEAQYSKVLKDFCGISGSMLLDYDKNPPSIDHGVVWGKRNRLLPRSSVKTFQSLSFMDSIRAIFGEFLITDEENLGFGNVYFRLARPGNHEDVGPPHADSWFWEIAGKLTGERFKVWIPLWPAVGPPAFKYIPRSHLNKDKFNYDITEKAGMRKPRIVTDIPQELYQFHGERSGVPILFHDDLLHGGVVIEKDLRISIEFTGYID
jgi:hypothetical protein